MACLDCGCPELQVRFASGRMYVSDFPATPDEPRPLAPLDVGECRACGLVQLLQPLPREHLFGDVPYWYASGINGLMREELRHVVRHARTLRPIRDGEWVLDIGANDGTLLRAWREHSWEGRPNRMAVEPATTFQRELRDAAEATLLEPFPTLALAAHAGQFACITSIAMIYSVLDPRAFAREVARLLAPDGLWIVQWQDLYQMLESGAVDNICHEHVTYPRFHDVERWADAAGLYTIAADPRAINGGSLRAVFSKDPHREYQEPTPIMRQESAPAPWPTFQRQYLAAIRNLNATVDAALAEGHRVDLLGASTKGNTLLQLADLGPDRIRQCWERHPHKIGRHTITGIPIVGEREGRQDPPELLICPIWQFRDAVVAREAAYLEEGGRIYFPLPVGEVVQATPQGAQPQVSCGATHDTGAVCALPVGHAENHRGPFAHGIAQWPK